MILLHLGLWLAPRAALAFGPESLDALDGQRRAKASGALPPSPTSRQARRSPYH